MCPASHKKAQGGVSPTDQICLCYFPKKKKKKGEWVHEVSLMSSN